MMLTDAVYQVLLHGYQTTVFEHLVAEDDLGQIAFGLQDDVIPEAEELCRLGLFEKRWCRVHDDLHWWVTPAGMEYVRQRNAATAEMN